jgi:hypothetical protein
VLQELEEEARANWEERAIYHAAQVTHLAGEAFETLSENRWSRRDCTEYQDELDWVMRTYQRVCDELDFTSMPAKMRRMACSGRSESTTSISGPQGLWRDFSKLTEVDKRRDARRLGMVVGMSGSTEMSSMSSTCPSRGWCNRTPPPWRHSPPYRWPMS